MAEIDLETLQEEFGITREPVDVVYEFPDKPSTPEQILQQNVVKANLVLDRIISEIEGGSMSARMAEVAAKTVDSITNLAATMGNLTFQFQDLQTKLAMIKLKERQVEIQQNKITQVTKIGNQNILVTNREDLLKLLKGDKNKQLEHVMKGEGEYDERNA